MFTKRCSNCEFSQGYDEDKILCFVSGELCGVPDDICEEWEASFEAYQNGDIPDEAIGM